MLRRSREKSSQQSDAETDAADDAKTLDAAIDAWVNSLRPTIGEVLLDAEEIEPQDLVDALHIQQTDTETARRLGEVLIDVGKLDHRRLARALATQFGLEVANLRSETPELDAIELVGEELARKHSVVPMRIDEDQVWIATADPLDREAIAELTAQCGGITLLVSTRDEILRVLDQTFDVLRDADVHIQAFELADTDRAEADEGLAVDVDAPIVQVVNRILTQGVRNRASDIHVEPQEHDLRVRYRIDGALSEAIRLPRRMGPPLASRIKVMADLNIVERRRPQDGQFSVLVDDRPIDVRTSVVATVHGEKVVMRLLDKKQSLIGLHELGMPDGLASSYLRIAKAPLGMVLCTGPTGSGKTTTLYATLNEINDDTRNVVTIEDPVEYHFAGVNQMQVSEIGGIDFADGLRGTLRQDPDVILVGEIRDVETARIATQAALTGHLVLSSLHAVDAASALHRFTDMGIEPFLVASAINAVVGQRLVRRTCASCRVPFEPTSDHVSLVAAEAGRVPTIWMKGAGCNLCNATGYRGRVGVYELLIVSDEVRDLIVHKATHAEMRAQAISEGMRTMQEEAFAMVADGLTTVDEVLRSVYAPTVDFSAPKALPPASAAGDLDAGDPDAGDLDGLNDAEATRK